MSAGSGPKATRATELNNDDTVATSVSPLVVAKIKANRLETAINIDTCLYLEFRVDLCSRGRRGRVCPFATVPTLEC